jgi:hypothetical protein
MLIGIVESSTGFGLILSGTVEAINLAIAYRAIFFLATGVIIVIGCWGIVNIPENVNENPGGEEKVYVTFCSFFKRKFVVLSFLTLFFACIFF